VRRLAVGRVDLVHRNRLAHDGGEVGDGAVGDGDAEGEPVELALEVGEDEADGLGGAGRGGDDGGGGGAGAAEVAVRAVLDVLVRRVGVDRRHVVLRHADGVVEDIDN